MGDPLNTPLETEYAAAADRARRVVAAEFDLYEVGVGALAETVLVEKLRTVWRIHLGTDSVVPYLFVAIPWIFPDELPDIYAPKDLIFAGNRIPHLDRNLQICTFNDKARFPNPDLAGEAVVELIEHAVQIIQDGIAGKNSSEYWEEFQSYWIDGIERLASAISTVHPEGPHRLVSTVALSPRIGPYSLLFGDDDNEVFDFLDAIECPSQASEKVAGTALYLHLNSTGGTPNLRTNLDIYRRLPADAREVLLRYLNAVKRPSKVLFSIPVAKDRVFGSWVHKEYGTHTYRGRKSHRVVDQVPGFQPGHLNSRIELSLKCAGQAIGRILVHRADSMRLFSRTQEINRSTLGPVNIIGCGSVGGLLARAIGYLRPSRLRLVDPEVLDLHNVPRHICDFSNVGQNKACAVRGMLRRSDPYLFIDSFAQDVGEILRKNAHLLTPAQLTIVAIANIAAERRTNELARSLDFGTLAFVWIEPHAIAGHAIIVPSKGHGCFECLLGPDLSPDISVLEKPEKFDRRDAGCRGSFIPYGGLDLEAFTTAIAREIVSACASSEGNIITWVGDLDWARNNDWPLTADWDVASNYSVHRRPILSRPDCRICGER